MNLASFIQSARFYTVETCPEQDMAALADNWAPIGQLAEIVIFNGVWYAWKLQGDPTGIWRTVMDRHDITGTLHDCARALWEIDHRPAPPDRRATIARLFMLAYTRVAGDHGTALNIYLGKALALMSLPHQADGVELEVRNLLNTAKAIFRMAKLNRNILPSPRRITTTRA